MTTVAFIHRYRWRA